MSIVERALQEALARAKTEADEPGTTPRSEGEWTLQAAKPAASHPGTPVAAEDALTLTSRDLKAIVSIDFDRLRAEGRLPTAALSTQIEDEIRRIKWPLLKAIEGTEGVTPARNNLVLVTSALPGEGKTFTSLNLALSIVRDREMRVVLVDGDVARPGLTPSLGLEGRPGLNDALEDTNRDVSTITYQTDVQGLYFVPAGTWSPHAPEFFAGSRMPQLMDALSRRVGRGVVIFDSPPLLATNEAQVATRFAGQVLVVVRADETAQQAVLDAIALIDKDVPVSAVLNGCRPSLLGSYYRQHYYGYGYGRGKDAQRGARAKGEGDA
jgi:Mrp family chromosome partitioning ATPase